MIKPYIASDFESASLWKYKLKYDISIFFHFQAIATRDLLEADETERPPSLPVWRHTFKAVLYCDVIVHFVISCDVINEKRDIREVAFLWP